MSRALLGVVTLLTLLVLSLAPAAEEAKGLQLGTASVDITPKVEADGKPVYLAGFGKNRKATGVHDPLYARAAVLREGKSKIAIVSVDLVGLFLDSVERVRKGLPGFTKVIVTSTHNHEGPDTMGLWGASPFQSGLDRNYLGDVEKKIVKAVKQADEACVAVEAKIGTIAVPELLHDSRPPVVKHDELVVLHFTDRKNRKTAGLLVQWNCHPETLDSRNTLVSADYVGYTVKYLSDKHRCGVVYLTGTVGGLMTSLHVPIRSEKGEALRDGTYEKTARFGELLGQATDRALAKSKAVALTPIVRSREIYLPLTNKFYVLAKQLGVLEREAYLWKNDLDKAEPVKEFDPKKEHAIRTEISHLRLGDLDVACIPGEIYPELVLGKVLADPAPAGADYPDAPREPGLYAQFKGPHRMIIGLACDEIGYILPKRQWDEKAPFTYGLKKAPYGEVNSLGPETGPLLCRAFKEMVGKKK